MTEDQVKVGGCYSHRTHGPCMVIYKNRNGFHISVWGGICGDKEYVFKGIKATDLRPRGEVACAGQVLPR